MFNKLVHVRDEIEKFIILGGSPRRTAPYVELAGFKAEYDNYGMTYPTIQTFEAENGIAGHQNPTWEKVRAVGQNVCLEANAHLEAGRPLAEWLPDLPTDYHYPLYTTEEHRKRALKLLAGTGNLRVGISCASYQGSAAWNTWDKDTWIGYLSRIKAEGWEPILIGGGWDDLTTEVADALDVECFVGRTSIGVCVEMLRELEAYIGFSSGLNVIRTVLDKPAMAFWPHHQQDLMNSWVPPDMLENRRYVARPWAPVEDVWGTTMRYLRLCGDEAERKPKLAVAR